MQWQTNLPLIAILRGITPDEALAHVGAVIDAGFDAVEIPLNSPQWEKSIPQVVDAYGEQALIGAGTVLQPEQVDRLAAMGCRLIVTPNIQPEVIRRAVGYGMTVCPGCATASEAFSALDAGAQALKIFPSSAFGPDYIKALKAVLPPAPRRGARAPRRPHRPAHPGVAGSPGHRRSPTPPGRGRPSGAGGRGRGPGARLGRAPDRLVRVGVLVRVQP